MTTHVNDEQQLLQVLGLILLLGPPGMSGEELRYLRTLYGMTQTALAKALGLPRRETIAEWEAKGRIFANPAAEIAPRLVLLNLLKIHVFESDHCFLADIHRQGYDTFAQSVVDRIQDMLIKKKSSRRLSLRRQSKTREWSADIITV
jgi:transcriptional regulator with XRE-family HTH domain